MSKKQAVELAEVSTESTKMNTELQAERDYIFNILSGRAQRVLQEDYDLGTKIRQICDNPTLYGEDAMTVLAESLQLYENLLYALRSFSTTYTKDDLKELTALNGPDGHPFPWTINHIRLFCQLKRKTQRVSMQNRCAKEGWSIRELQSNIQRLLPDTSKGKSPGRPPSAPKGLDGHLELFADMSNIWVDRVNRFGEDFVDLAKEHEDWNKDQIKKLEKLSKNAHTMSESSASLLRELADIHRKISGKPVSDDIDEDDILDESDYARLSEIASYDTVDSEDDDDDEDAEADLPTKKQRRKIVSAK